MEPHPIPQNVTSFEFHLVGDMTLKQFMFLSSGLGVSYLLFVFLSPQNPFLAYPLILLFSFLGVAFAFMGIADRSLDHWLWVFIKAVFSPTKRVWGKAGKSYAQNNLFSQRSAFFNQVVQTSSSPFEPITSPVAQTNVQPLPTEEELQKTVTLAREAQSLQTRIIESERQLESIKVTPQNISPQQIEATLSTLQKLVTETSGIKEQLLRATHQKEQPKPSEVKITPASFQRPIQAVLTSLPNVINGVVKDALGNFLEGVVVVIYNKEGLPVRALKTNKLGQFSGSTPLPNNSYRIELEKDDLLFDILQIDLTGLVLPAMEILSKKRVFQT